MHSSALQQKLEVVRFLGYFGALEAHWFQWVALMQYTLMCDIMQKCNEPPSITKATVTLAIFSPATRLLGKQSLDSQQGGV